MEDILEEMLGTFQKRDEQTFLFEKLAPGKWRVNGTCPLDEFRREYPALPQIEEVDTMGGLLVRQLEYVPAEGESVVHAGLRLTAQKADDRRVMEVLAEAQRK
jgi:CBS domain containing-hemolysin-like protein